MAASLLFRKQPEFPREKVVVLVLVVVVEFSQRNTQGVTRYMQLYVDSCISQGERIACVDVLLLSRHMSGNSLSSGELSPFLEVGNCYARSLS